jgi:tRNA 2-selenouridine synthase
VVKKLTTKYTKELKGKNQEFMPTHQIDIIRFLELAETIPIADVRSPSEFSQGHIPGAVNIPLFEDNERESVGKKYKKEGRLSAILEGLSLTGPSIKTKLEQGLNIAAGGKLLVHCWRGGMRSEAMAWLFSLGDIDVDVLAGGYKTYRRYLLEKLCEKRKMIILGGMTGSSKSHILRYLGSAGHQILDLENLANHKGSAFGALGQPPQPTTEQFANFLFQEWIDSDPARPCWIEDESRNIGSVFLPDEFYLNMQDAPVIVLVMDIKTRLPRLIEEYARYPPESLRASILKISKRLGGDNTRDAIAAVDTGNIEKAIEISLNYYDKAYRFGLTKKESKNLIYVDTDTDDIEMNALKVLEAASKIKW